MTKRLCSAMFQIDDETMGAIAICERPEGHTGRHKCGRVVRKDLFVTLWWDKDCKTNDELIWTKKAE